MSKGGKERENARLALAAFPEWSRAMLRMNHTRAELEDAFADMAEQALAAGWAVVGGEPVAPDSWRTP